MKKMKWSLFSVLMVLLLALAACGTTDNQDGTTTDKKDNVENTRYNTGTGDRGNTGDGMTGNRDHTMIRDSERDQNRNNNGTNNMNNNNTKYSVAKEAADRITNEVKDIDHAYVLSTGNNAYVAANLDTDGTKRDRNNTGKNSNNGDNMNNNNANNTNNEGDEVTDDVKKQVSKIVKSLDSNIDHVYVSTNPDFLDLTGNYVDQTNKGKPVKGFFDQFGNMVERLFPQNR